ncbi:MAG TPA: coproporphyrinogen-III oxidase family protein [Blastocatellia bacterium]
MLMNEYSQNWIKEYPDVDREYMETYPLNFRPINVEPIFEKKNLHLYIHVPFCSVSCSFCTFLHFDRTNANVNAYVPNLLKEISLWFGQDLFSNYEVRSIFFGGGTATALNAEHIGDVLDYIRRSIAVDEGAEITVEAHPNTVNEQYLSHLRAKGVNRMTFGIQSFNDRHLTTMEITQSSARNNSVLKLSKSLGFESVCMDLMFSLPGQTHVDLAQDLEDFFALDLDGISCYRYVIDPENKMPEEKKRWLQSIAPSEEEGNQMYAYLVEGLAERGYVQYTQPDFAKPDKICRYTTGVWKAPQEEQLGLGVGALSYNINNFALVNTHDLHEHAECLAQNRLPVLMGTKITPDELMRKYFVLGMKCLEVDTKKFEELFGLHYQLLFQDEVRKLERLEMIVEDNGVLRLTPRGKIYVDYVCKQFYSYRNKGLFQPDGYTFARMRMRPIQNSSPLPQQPTSLSQLSYAGRQQELS